MKLTDWMAIPYRKSFDGVSGPMVEAISQGIPCFVPAGGSLQYFCDKYHAAMTFVPENAFSLGGTVRAALSGQEVARPTNIEQLSCDYFIKKHQELYNTLYE